MKERADLIRARNEIRDAMVTLAGGLALGPDAVNALAALDIAIARTGPVFALAAAGLPANDFTGMTDASGATCPTCCSHDHSRAPSNVGRAE